MTPDDLVVGSDGFAVNYGRIRLAAQSHAAKYRRRSDFDWEDLAQESIVRVLSGRKSWDGPMQDMIRKETLITNWVRVSKVYRRRESTPVIFSALDRRMALPAQQTCLMARVSLALLALSEQERDTIRMEFWEGMTQKEIGSRIGFHPSRVSQFRCSAIRKLREAVTHRSSSTLRI